MTDSTSKPLSSTRQKDKSAPSVPPGEQSDFTRTTIAIAAMDCPTEENLIRGKLSGLPGVEALDFNLIERTLTLTHRRESLDPAIAAIRTLGMQAVVQQNGSAPKSAARENVPWWPIILSGCTATAAEIVHWFDGGNHTAEAALALVSILSGGLRTYQKGLIALWNRNLNINALMSIAVSGAMVIGEWPEAAMVMFLFALAEIIEALSLDRARNAIRHLLALAPETATLRLDDGTWAEVEAKTVAIGSIVRVRPGERIALDGIVVAGRSTVNQATITGESLPVEKSGGDPVFAGTINDLGSFEYRVTEIAANSTLARIIHVVEEAQSARAPTQRFVDRFARIYTPAVCLVALITAVVPPLALNATWTESVYRALVLLVIACPCALVISTPVTVVSGLAAAARRGVLIKGGAFLEQGRRLKVLALDKTGTITHGRPAQTDFICIAGTDQALMQRVAASLADRSDHPVSQAIASKAKESGIGMFEVSDFEALPGRGVRGRINGRTYTLGNHRLVEETNLCTPDLETTLTALEEKGRTVVMLADESRVLSIFAVADTVKASSREAVAELRALGVRPVMLTGDNPHTAKAIAAQVGIDDVRSDLLPLAKVSVIESLLSANGVVGMVGDGINDAPALARADIGFAMGAAGTHAAIETADVALMDDDLRKVPLFIRLSRTTFMVLAQNIALALSIKAIFIGMAITGSASMWMAVFADMGASLIVVFNGLRLLRH